MDIDYIIQRYESYYNSTISWRDSLNTDSNSGHFHHIIGNELSTVTILLAFAKRRNLKNTQRMLESAKSARQSIRQYKLLLRDFPEFTDTEMGKGYFNIGSNKPLVDGTPTIIFGARDYVNYAVKYFKG